jgi:hypothetical protein
MEGIMKQLFSIKIYALVIIMLSLMYSIIKADLPKDNYPKSFNSLAPVSNIFMGGNNIFTVFRSDGIFNFDKITFQGVIAGFIWPVSNPSRLTIDFASGLWLGAKVILQNNQKELRAAGCLYNSIFTPGNIPVIGGIPPQSVCDDPSWKAYLVNLIDSSLVNGGVRTRIAGGYTYTITYDSWANWPVNKGAPYVEVNNIQGYQPGWNADRPGIGFGNSRPAEICFMVYMDYTNCTDSVHVSEISFPGGTKPMGVEIQQLAYIFNCPGFENSYFIRWKIINKSSNVWDSTYIGMVNDADVGDGDDDAMGCDSLREIAFTYNADNYDNFYGANPPAIGSRLLQGPLVHTGNNSDTARLPYGTFIGYKLIKMSSANVFWNYLPCLRVPSNPEQCYYILEGLDGCGNPFINSVTGQPTKFVYSGDACNRVDWFDSSSLDRRTIQSVGPLVMNPGDTQTIVIAFVIGRSTNNFQSVCEMLTSSDAIKNAYYYGLCSSVNGITPISGNVPNKYELFQNYPNPFNPTTKIKFDIAGTGGQLVKLIIFDALGREVSTLVNEQLKPGSYEANWDSINFTSGVYFYKLVVGNYMATKKMILLK